MPKQSQPYCAKKISDDEKCPYRRYGLSKFCAGHYLEERSTQPLRERAQKARAHRKPPKPHDIPAEVRAIVLERCGGFCEASGEPLTGVVHMHHRLRRRDGHHLPSNIVALLPEW